MQRCAVRVDHKTVITDLPDKVVEGDLISIICHGESAIGCREDRILLHTVVVDKSCIDIIQVHEHTV